MPTAPPAVGKILPPKLQKALARLTEISSLPEITARIVQLVEDPCVTAHEMHAVIRTDPALAAKILKVVNSAFYGLPAQIASLDRAMLMLGLSAVKNIALAASLARMFKAEAVTEQFAARDLWRHCVAVGVCTRLLAGVARFPHVDEAFVSGLMHDMGLIVVQQLFPARLRQVAEQCQNQPQGFCAVEERMIGADHQVFGGALAAKWRFPPGLRSAIACHHEPATLKAEFRKLATIVYAADTLCAEQRYGFWLTAQTQAVSAELLASADLDGRAVETVLAELPARVEEAERILGD